jgi:hypothetical protein
MPYPRLCGWTQNPDARDPAHFASSLALPACEPLRPTISRNIHDLKAAYEKAIGHPTSDSTVYNLLHRHGWRKLKPRPFHPKRDFAAQNAFKKTAFLML